MIHLECKGSIKEAKRFDIAFPPVMLVNAKVPFPDWKWDLWERMNMLYLPARIFEPFIGAPNNGAKGQKSKFSGSCFMF
jgi:hypothetical protein